MNITQFTMEEVRCFAERQQFEIRPLTFLVGGKQHRQDNSTGVFSSVGKLFEEWRSRFQFRALFNGHLSGYCQK